jgi:hypothetical protein
MLPGTDGGPDTWGYTYVDSDTTPGVPGRPDFNWIDIRLLPGAQRVEGLVDDNVIGPFSLGFEFRLYWLRLSQFFVGSNGYIAFEDQFNQSHPYPNVPDPSRPNDLLAALMCDLDFTRLSGNRGCWFWTNNTNDTFVLQCESVPFWNTGGNNTFEVILSKPDSTITYQYKEQSGQPAGGWGNNNLTIGIEDVNGSVGLSYCYRGVPAANLPHAGLAVRFIPPSTSAFTRNDLMCVKSMTWNSGGFFMYASGTPSRPIWVQVKNAGTEPAPASEVTGEIVEYGGSTVWFNSGYTPPLASGEEFYLDLGAWTPLPPYDTGTFTLKVKVNYAADEYRANDSILVEIRIVDYGLGATLHYDRQTSGTIALSDTHGYAVRFEPPRFPAWIDSLYFYFGSVAPVNVFIYGDAGDRPGALLDSIYWSPPAGAGWKSLSVRDDSISIQSGAFYVGYKTFGSSPSCGVDRVAPFSRQCWEWTGDWAPMRWTEDEDLLIRARVISGFATHNLGVDSITEPTLTMYDSGAVITPRVRVKNYGTFAYDTGNVVFTLFDENLTAAYADTLDTIVVRRQRDTALTYASWVARPGPLGGVYTPRCSVRAYSADLDPANDTLGGVPFFVRYTDAGATAIIAPLDTIGYGVSVTPSATIRNHGNVALVNLVVQFRIGSGYSGTETIASLGGRSATTVTFDPWLTDSGTFAVSCWTELAGDQVPDNDTAYATARVNLYDIGATSIDAPSGIIVQGTRVYPVVSVQDFGSLGATCDLRLVIRDAGGTPVYDTTNTGVVVPGGGTVAVGFTKYFDALTVGDYSTKAYTIFAADPHPANDTARDSFYVRSSSYTDVGAFEILVPRDTVREFTQVRPQVTVRNYGTTTEVCNLTFVIEDSPTNFSLTMPVAVVAGADTTVRYDSSWTAQNQGMHRVWAYTFCPGDTHAVNDTVYDSTRVTPPPVLDVGVVSIVAPTDSVDSSAAVLPTVAVQNYGQLPATFRVWVGIADSVGAEVYFDTATVVDLPQGPPLQVALSSWSAPHVVGNYSVRCSTFMVGDQNPQNDTVGEVFRVYAPPQLQPWVAGWSMARELPQLPSTRFVKDGGWLVFNPGNGLIYGAKGNKTVDFFSYDPLAITDTWHTLTGMPVPAGSRLPGKGGVGCTDGSSTIYALKGNNTREFYKFDVALGSWTALESVPAGVRNQRIKGGSDMVYVDQGDSSYVYLLKGYKNEFYRFNTTSGRWQALESAPGGTGAKWDKGSFLVYDGDQTIYAHRAKFQQMYLYNITTGWSATMHQGMNSTSYVNGRTTKTRDGGCGAWGRDGIYALKGSNTQEFWHYVAAGDTWTPMDTMPQIGTGGRKKRVKSGADIVAWCDTVFFAFKGNKCNEFWRYVKAPAGGAMSVRPGRDGVSSAPTRPARNRVRIAPNPLSGRVVSLSYTLPQAGVLTVGVYDVTGRPVLAREFVVGRTGAVRADVSELAAGVYLVRFTSAGFSSTDKLIIKQ